MLVHDCTYIDIVLNDSLSRSKDLAPNSKMYDKQRDLLTPIRLLLEKKTSVTSDIEGSAF